MYKILVLIIKKSV